MELLAQNLENQGITIVIEKELSSNDKNNEDYSLTTLQFNMNGMGFKKNIIFILVLEMKEMTNY